MPYINETWIGVPRDLKDYLDSKKPKEQHGHTGYIICWSFTYKIINYYLTINKKLVGNFL